MQSLYFSQLTQTVWGFSIVYMLNKLESERFQHIPFSGMSVIEATRISMGILLTYRMCTSAIVTAVNMKNP